jgi:uncharacterized membrane protein YidH (DUF202 family)
VCAQRDAGWHGDSGLQPERTDLAWNRTTMAMVVAAAVFLRWLPHHGWFLGTLVAGAGVAALAINLTQKRRFSRAVQGIKQETMPPHVVSTAAVAATVVALSLLGIYTVLFLPLRL